MVYQHPISPPRAACSVAALRRQRVLERPRSIIPLCGPGTGVNLSHAHRNSAGPQRIGQSPERSISYALRSPRGWTGLCGALGSHCSTSYWVPSPRPPHAVATHVEDRHPAQRGTGFFPPIKRLVLAEAVLGGCGEVGHPTLGSTARSQPAHKPPELGFPSGAAQLKPSLNPLGLPKGVKSAQSPRDELPGFSPLCTAAMSNRNNPLPLPACAHRAP